MRAAILMCVLGACGARYRYEPAGRGAVRVGGAVDDASAAPGASGVTARAGVRHDVIVRVSLPRAEVVTWSLACPGATASGTMGETMDAYRARRLAELRADRDRARANAAAIGGAIGGAVLGHASATAQAGPVVAGAQVDGAAVGAAVGAQTVQDDVQLAPGDVGGGAYTDRVTVVPDGDGACTVTVTPDGDAGGIAGDFEVTRVFNRDAEERERRAIVVGHANDVRVSLRGALIAMGADPELRARARAEASARAEADATARLQIEAQARARAEAEANARVQVEADLRTRAWSVRGGVVAWLTTCGGDPHKREREREAQARLEADRRARADAEDARVRAQAAAFAEAEARRDQLALRVRDAQIAILVSLGGVVRPPMPEAPDEQPGPAQDGATWVAGHWEWDAPRWIWQPGFWDGRDEVVGAVGAVVDVVTTTTTSTSTSTTSATGTATVDTAPIRDHRDATPPAPPAPPPPANRDHRTTTTTETHPAGNRDHRR